MLLGREAPGIGMTTGERASSGASGAWLTPALTSSATSWHALWRSACYLAFLVPPEWAPWRECDVGPGAVFELAQAGGERGREWVLNGHEATDGYLAGRVDLCDVGVGDAGHEDHALVEEITDRAHRVGVRRGRVEEVELVQAHRVDARAASGLLGRTVEVPGVTVPGPGAVAGRR